MKTNKLEVMRNARWKALHFQNIRFTTINLDAGIHGSNPGHITVAYKKYIPEEGSRNFIKGQEGYTYYRIQFAFCSPREKNPSRIFGEGLAALRWTNEKSAILLTIPPEGKFIDHLHRVVLLIANMNHISWLKNVTLKDLV